MRFGTVTSVSPGICTVKVAGGEIPVIYLKGGAPTKGDFVAVHRQGVVSYLLNPPSGGLLMFGGSTTGNIVALVSPQSGAAASPVSLPVPSGYGLLLDAAPLGPGFALVPLFGPTLTTGMLLKLTLPSLSVAASVDCAGLQIASANSISGVVACFVSSSATGGGFSGMALVDASLAQPTYDFPQILNNVTAAWDESADLLWVLAQPADNASAPFQVLSLDPASGAYSAPFEPFPASAVHPFSGQVIDFASHLMFVADYLVAQGYVVDLSTGSLVATIPLEGNASSGFAAVDQVRHNWYVPVSTASGGLQVISTESYATVASIPFPESLNEVSNLLADDAKGAIYIGADASTGTTPDYDVLITVDEIALARTATVPTGDWEGPWLLG
jgi:hypothetical protein